VIFVHRPSRPCPAAGARRGRATVGWATMRSDARCHPPSRRIGGVRGIQRCRISSRAPTRSITWPTLSPARSTRRTSAAPRGSLRKTWRTFGQHALHSQGKKKSFKTKQWEIPATLLPPTSLRDGAGCDARPAPPALELQPLRALQTCDIRIPTRSSLDGPARWVGGPRYNKL